MKSRDSYEWTDEIVAQTMKYFDEGKSFAEIAALLPGQPSRNAVLGKVHRIRQKLGIPSKPRISRLRRTAPREPGQSQQPESRPSTRRQQPGMPKVGGKTDKPRSAPGRALVLAAPPPLGVITVQMVGNDTCRWPIGDPQAPDFTFCGHPPAGKSPYCPYHTQMAYEPRAYRREKA